MLEVNCANCLKRTDCDFLQSDSGECYMYESNCNPIKETKKMKPEIRTFAKPLLVVKTAGFATLKEIIIPDTKDYNTGLKKIIILLVINILLWILM